MRAGRLRHRLVVFEREGMPPRWSKVRTLWGSLEPPKGAQKTQLREIGGIGLRYPMAYVVLFRREASPTAGQLLRHTEPRGGAIRYFSIDAVADQNERGAEFVATCREFVGLPARYVPADGREPYICRAQPVHSNPEEMFPLRAQEQTISLEFLVAELQWPYAQRGDRVTCQGVEHLLDGVPEFGADGYELTCHTVHTPPAVTKY